MRLLSTTLLGALALGLLTLPLAAQEYEPGSDIEVMQADAHAEWDDEAGWVDQSGIDPRVLAQYDHATVSGAEHFVIAGVLTQVQLDMLNAVMAQHSDVTLSIEPSGELFHVHAMVDATQLDHMMLAHRESGLNLGFRVMAVGLAADEGVVAGWHGTRGSRGMRGARGGHMGARGMRGPGHGKGRGMRRGMARGAHGAWDCSNWARDWHQQGCGHVHTHNLADWMPHREGWHSGWHYSGWDHNSWPHVRGDGSHAWYTGEFMATHNIVDAQPLWFDAEWVAFGRAYPDRFWGAAYAGNPHYTKVGWNACRSSCGKCGGCGWKASRCGCPRTRCRCR